MSLFDRWFGKRPTPKPDPQPESIPVTAISQEYAHIQSHPCDCGGHWQLLQRSTGQVPGAAPHFKLDTHEMSCSKCGLRRVFRFRVDTSHPDYLRELAQTERELLSEEPAGSSSDSTVVPPGHKVETFSVPENPDPSFYALGDSTCVISLGHGSDEPVEEIDDLLRQLDNPRTWDPQRPARVVRASGPISTLFAPADLPLQAVPRLLLWVFTKPSLNGWLEDPAQLQALLRRLYRLEKSVSQFFYFEADCGPGAAVLARLMGGLGLYVKVLEPDSERIVLVKVHRPEGIAVIGLAGRPFPLEGPAVDSFLATVNAEKDQAEARGDAPRLQALEQRERDYLARALQPLQSQLNQTPVVRAPHLCRLLRTVVDRGGPMTRMALEQELLGRVRPLLLIMEPDGKSMSPAHFEGVGTVLRVYPDLRSLQMAVKDLGLAKDAYLIAGMAVRDIFDLAAEQNIAVGLNVYMTPHTPTYVYWLADEARLMAKGQLPSAAPPRPRTKNASPESVGELVADTRRRHEAADKPTPEHLQALLSQTDVFIEHAHYERAFELLRKIFAEDPENLDAHEKAYRIYVASGKTQEASGQLLNVLRLCTRRKEVQRAQPYLAVLLQREPHHPEMPSFLAVLRPGGRPYPTA